MLKDDDSLRSIGHKRRATRAPRVRPGLFVTIDGPRPIVRIVAGDLLEQRELEHLAELVAHVLEHAIRRGTGAA